MTNMDKKDNQFMLPVSLSFLIQLCHRLFNVTIPMEACDATADANKIQPPVNNI